MKESFHKTLLQLFKAKKVEKVEVIQNLWSGYGKISRLSLVGGKTDSIITKNIQFPTQQNHPRGWNTDRSHLRKAKSYEVEVEWYKKWADRCDVNCRVPKCFELITNGDEHIIVLEDLDAAGFSIRKSALNKKEVKLGLRWLANFHSIFLNEAPKGLWEQGSYWHLATRPDEFAAMGDGKLKSMAVQLDRELSDCQFQTIIHGDAKVANFCFSEDMKSLAAVDFQYIGGGCGMKDVVYFLGSCLSDMECEKFEVELLAYYFTELEIALVKANKADQFNAIEKEWRMMYPIAWTDFTRFLLGWMPTHHKINRYSSLMIDRAINILK